MRKISHRGNLFGPNPKKENDPSYIVDALQKGFDVEIDVWYHDSGDFYLGHDYAKHKIETNFLKNEKLWCHAKNFSALRAMLENNLQCFWHQKDDYTLTSNNFIWTYPKKKICNKSIIVCGTLEESIDFNKSDAYGICSDYVGEL